MYFDVIILHMSEIMTIKDLADKDIPDLKLKQITKWKMQAKALINKDPIILKKTILPETDVEIFFDIESDPDFNIDYLYGLLVREKGKEKYIDFWASSVEEEKKLWKDFLSFIASKKDFTIYYYTSYELQSLKRLKQRYGIDEKLYRKILDNAVDLYTTLTKNVILPVYSYSIKPVARYLGFDWKSEKASGSQSMVWYSEYIKAKDKKIKDVIIQYNKDDCVATRVLKDWLVK